MLTGITFDLLVYKRVNVSTRFKVIEVNVVLIVVDCILYFMR